ncbi:MAG TPA: nuclear transport factor 2 family protein [Kofleriaceae bacterium]
MNHKEVARTFLRWAAAGRVAEAYDKFLTEGFKHHNAGFAADKESLKKAMEESAREAPNKQLDIVRVIEDGDVVAVHSHLKQADPKMPEIAVVHILRFEGDKIAEFWDVAQPVPQQSPNANGMF